MNTEDDVKELILKYLYDYNKKKGLWTTPLKVVSDIKSPEVDKVQILNNISYLIGEKYINKKTVKTKGCVGGTITFEKIIISNKGIQHFEDSKFSVKQFSSINIQSVQGSNNVFILGDQTGTINQTVGNSIAELDKLIDQIKSQELSVDKERELIGDVETIKSQLIKPSPSSQIIKIAWLALNGAATLSGSHDLMLKIGMLLQQYLTH
ncbi:MAG: hypothetical protein WC851_00285 [Candidatus Shapirobacteria bacterium]|jgi:hypothetical protein